MVDRIHDIWLDFNPAVHVEAELIGGKNLNMIIQQCIWEIIAEYVENTKRFRSTKTSILVYHPVILAYY